MLSNNDRRNTADVRRASLPPVENRGNQYGRPIARKGSSLNNIPLHVEEEKEQSSPQNRVLNLQPKHYDALGVFFQTTLQRVANSLRRHAERNHRRSDVCLRLSSIALTLDTAAKQDIAGMLSYLYYHFFSSNAAAISDDVKYQLFSRLITSPSCYLYPNQHAAHNLLMHCLNQFTEKRQTLYWANDRDEVESEKMARIGRKIEALCHIDITRQGLEPLSQPLSQASAVTIFSPNLGRQTKLLPIVQNM